MYNMQTADLIAELLKFGKDAMAVVAEGGKAEDFINGVERAKETIAKADEVKARLKRAEDLDSANELVTRANEEQKRVNAAKEKAVNDRELAAQAVEAKQKAEDKRLDKWAGDLAALKGSLDAQKREQDKKQEILDADLAEAAKLKKAAADRLTALNNIPAE